MAFGKSADEVRAEGTAEEIVPARVFTGNRPTASIMAPDVPWLRALEGACQATLGRRADARAMLVGLQALRHSEYIDAYFMAVFRCALGQPREALAELERAQAENSAWLYTQDVDPMLDVVRAERGFRRLLRRRAS